MRITEIPLRIGMTRLKARRNRCSTTTRSRSGRVRMLGRIKRKNPNSAHARKPGTIRSKNSKQSIVAEDDRKKSNRDPAEKVQEDFIEAMSLFDVAEMGGAFQQN